VHRRAAVLLLLVAPTACATPPVTLQHRFEPGASRVYRVEVETDTVIDAGGIDRTERETLQAESRLDVLETGAAGATVRLTITPERRTLDGEVVAAPAAQSAEVVIAPDGTVREVRRIGGLTPEVAGTDPDELIALLGPPLPQGRVRVAQRWRTPLPDGGEQRGRVRSLRVVDGYDCAIVVLGTARRLERVRRAGGATVRLAGTETAATEIAFAFRDGFPVEVTTDAEARMQVLAGAVTGGDVVITTHTEIRLVQP